MKCLTLTQKNQTMQKCITWFRRFQGVKKQKNEYLGHRLQKLRAKLQLKGKNVDKKLLDKCRRHWSSLVRDADRRQTSEEVKAENQSIFTKGIDLSKENYPIFWPEPLPGKPKKYCCFPMCKNHDRTHYLQQVPKKEPHKIYKNRRGLYSYHGRKNYQKMIWKRLRIESKRPNPDLRFCYAHATETYREIVCSSVPTITIPDCGSRSSWTNVIKHIFYEPTRSKKYENYALAT